MHRSITLIGRTYSQAIKRIPNRRSTRMQATPSQGVEDVIQAKNRDGMTIGVQVAYDGRRADTRFPGSSGQLFGPQVQIALLPAAFPAPFR